MIPSSSSAPHAPNQQHHNRHTSTFQRPQSKRMPSLIRSEADDDSFSTSTSSSPSFASAAKSMNDNHGSQTDEQGEEVAASDCDCAVHINTSVKPAKDTHAACTDEDLIHAMNEALSGDVKSDDDDDGRRKKDMSKSVVHTGSSGWWPTNNNGGGDSSNTGGYTRKMIVVGGGQGLLPPDIAQRSFDGRQQRNAFSIGTAAAVEQRAEKGCVHADRNDEVNQICVAVGDSLMVNSSPVRTGSPYLSRPSRRSSRSSSKSSLVDRPGSPVDLLTVDDLLSEKDCGSAVVIATNNEALVLDNDHDDNKDYDSNFAETPFCTSIEIHAEFDEQEEGHMKRGSAEQASGNGRSTCRRKPSLSNSDSTFPLSNVLQDLLDAEKEPDRKKQVASDLITEAKEDNTSAPSEDSADFGDDKSIDLEEATGDNKPPERDTASILEKGGEAKQWRRSRSNGSSRSLSVNLNSSSSLNEKLASQSSGLHASEHDIIQSLRTTSKAYLERYQRCKNVCLFDNLDKAIEKQVVAPARGGKQRTKEEQDKANVLLRRRVRMCFAALTVLFGAGLDEEDEEFHVSEQGDRECSDLFHDSILSVNEDASIHSGVTQLTNASQFTTASKRSRRRKSQRWSSEASEATSTDASSVRAPSKERPPVPLAVTRLLFTSLIRRRGGLDLDADFVETTATAEVKGDNGVDPDEKAKKAQASISVIVDDVMDAILTTLGLVDVISNFDSNKSCGLQRRRQMKCPLLLDSTSSAIATVSDDSSSEDSCIFITHDKYLLFGLSMALMRPDIFFESNAAYERYLYKNATTMSTWDAEIELNYDMADACLDCIKQRHASSPVGGRRPPTPEYRYSLEAAPLHLLRCGRYRELTHLLAKTSYVRRKLRALGLLKGTKLHIADVEEMNEELSDLGDSTINMGECFTTSFQTMYDVLRTFDRQMNYYSKDGSARLDNKSLARQIEISESYHVMGTSLQEHAFDEDSISAYTLATEKYEEIRDIMITSGAHRERMVCESSQGVDNVHLLPSLANLQFQMAETLRLLAGVYDESGNLQYAILSLERALALYSKERSLRHRDGVASVLYAMGIIHFRQRECSAAASCFDEAHAIFQSLEVNGNKSEEIGEILQWLGNIKRESGEPDKALALFSEAFYIITLKYGNVHPRVGRIHQSLAIIFDDMGDYDNSISHYSKALGIRRSAAVAVQKSDEGSVFMVATIEELAVAETLLCMGNVYYHALNNMSKAYECYVEGALIMKLDVTALLSNADLTVDGILDLLLRGSLESNLSAVSILYARLMKALDAARELDLQLKENFITGKEYPDTDEVGDGGNNFIRTEQVSSILYDVGCISAAKYLQAVDSDVDRLEELSLYRIEAVDCFRRVITMRKERLETLSKLFDNEEANDYRQIDEQLIIAYSLYEIGRLFSSPFSGLEKREDKRKQDIAAALSAFCESRDVLKHISRSTPDSAVSEISYDAATSRTKRIPEVLEDITQTMAILYRENDQYEKAVEMYHQVLCLHSNVSTRHSVASDDSSHYITDEISREEKVAQAIEDIGEVLRDQGNFQRALDHYQEALQLRLSTDEGGMAIAKSYQTIGLIHLEREEWNSAIQKFEEAVNLIDEQEAMVAPCYHSIGKAYEGKKEYLQALSFMKKARGAITRNNANDILISSHIHFDIGNILLMMNKPPDAFTVAPLRGQEFTLALECLSIASKGYRESYGNVALETANSIFLQGELFYGRGQYEAAIAFFEEALQTYREVLGEDDLRVATTLNMIGIANLESGIDDEHAMECFDACLAILQQEGHDGSEDHACVLFYKAVTHEKNDQLDLAVVCYEVSAKCYCDLLGKNDIKVASVLWHLGQCLLNDREPDQAKMHLEEALRIRKEHRKDNDIETSELYYALGIVYCEGKAYNKSLDSYERAFHIKSAILGESDVEVAQVLNNVGSVFARSGEYERALAPWSDALTMYRDAGLDDENERVACTLENIAVARSMVSVNKVGAETNDSSIRTFLIY